MELRDGSSLGHQGRAIREHHCVESINLLAVARHLESVGGRAYSLASERQQKSALSVHMHCL